MPLQDYAWTLLNASSPWSARFISSGSFSRHLVRTSISGVPSKTDLRVELDGVDLEWVPRENIGVDRWFYDFYVDAPLEGGDHEITFSLMNSEREGDAQLCSVEILEFGDDEERVHLPFVILNLTPWQVSKRTGILWRLSNLL